MRGSAPSFHAIRKLKADYAWAIDLKLCVFPQEGLTNDPGTEKCWWRHVSKAPI